MGGMVALRLALAQPERVTSLVLMDTSARSVSPAPRWVLELVGKTARRIPPRLLWRVTRAGRRGLPEPMRRTEQRMGIERYWERLRVKLEAMDPIAHEVLMGAIMDQQPLTARLPEIHCPSLVLVGEVDVTFHECSKELADGIPDSKLVIVEDSHHSPQIEAPELWLQEIRAHLERVRA
jgi:proline iminopeptidase